MNKTFKNIWVIAYYTYLEAVRGKALWFSFFAMLGCLSIVQLIDQLVLTDQAITRIAFLAPSVRVAAVVIVAAFGIAGTVRDIQDQGLNLMLALAQPRSIWLYGKWLGQILISIAVVILVSLPIWLFCPPQAAGIWMFSLFLELILISGCALLIALTFSQAAGAIIAFTIFYIMARVMPLFTLLASHLRANDQSMTSLIADYIIRAVAWVLPRFDLFTPTDGLIQATLAIRTSTELNLSTASPIEQIAIQTVIYTLLLLIIGNLDLKRKEI